MSRQFTVNTQTTNQQITARSGDFVLYPDRSFVPIITTQPTQTFSQTTWIVSQDNNQPIYQQKNNTTSTFIMLIGTSASWRVEAFDPSIDTTSSRAPDDTNIFEQGVIKYTWKKDDIYLFNYNSQNNGLGTAVISIPSQSCLPDISGRYVCEVSNNYGVVETEPIDIFVVDPISNPLFYRNVVQNGSGDGGTAEWVTSDDIVVKPFSKDAPAASHNFGSLYRLEYPVQAYINDSDTIYPNSVRQKEFYFSQGGHQTLFYPIWNKARLADPTIQDFYSSVTIESPSVANALGWQAWVAQSYPAQIVLNEDYSTTGQLAGFFPGMYWMDLYNKNVNTEAIGLFEESRDQNLTYFTRDKIKFVKYEGSLTSELQQTVDLTSYRDYINGNVFGVNFVSSQLFAYIGAGITRYQVFVTRAGGERISTNWFVLSSEEFETYVIGDSPLPAVLLEPGSTIDIVPYVDDRTQIIVEYINENEEILGSDIVDGPTERDVFAIKEKVFFPASLYSISQFLRDDSQNLPIRVFGQTYTTTEGIRGMTFNPGSENADKNVAFFQKKFNFARYQILNPPSLLINDLPVPDLSKQNKALQELGAAAMFGVGKTSIIPRGTTAARVRVVFSHQTTIPQDEQPEFKGWTKQEIYTNMYGYGARTNSERIIEYGFPRCGITKIKFILGVNDLKPTPEHATYFMPPANGTVLGLQKAALNLNIHNTSNLPKAEPFEYRLVQPNLPDINRVIINAAENTTEVGRVVVSGPELLGPG